MARRPSPFQNLLVELKRRSVFKVATVYAVTAWGASLGAAELLPAFGARQTTMIYGSQGTVRVAWLDGSGTHERVFATTFRIGRDESCELHLDDPLISRQHAEVSHSEGLWWIKDLGSRNGTLLDDRRVTRVPLPTRCTVKLYETGPELRLQVKAAASAPTVAAAQLRPPPR